jgi:hypothetical protein
LGTKRAVGLVKKARADVCVKVITVDLTLFPLVVVEEEKKQVTNSTHSAFSLSLGGSSIVWDVSAKKGLSVKTETNSGTSSSFHYYSQ